MVEDKGHAYRETMQEVLLELKLKTLKLFKKFKKGNKDSNIKYD
jgi:hypothetical protein